MFGIATLVMGGNSYVNAAIALAKSLHKYIQERDVDLICLITSDVTEKDEIQKYYKYVYTVDRISVTDIPNVGGTLASKIYHWISDAPTKWNILSLDQYEKILFLDADMIVLQDIYELFSLPVPAAMFDHQIAREYVSNPLWTGDKDKGIGFLNWYKIALGLATLKSREEKTMETGTKIPSSCIENLRLHSNSQFSLHGGIALLKPDKQLLYEYIQSLPQIIQSLQRKKGYKYIHTDTTLSSIDEITLAIFMHNKGYTWTHIGMEYNVSAFHTYRIFQDRTKILHYVGCYKPWLLDERKYIAEKYDSGKNTFYQYHYLAVELWWKIFDTTIL